MQQHLGHNNKIHAHTRNETKASCADVISCNVRAKHAIRVDYCHIIIGGEHGEHKPLCVG